MMYQNPETRLRGIDNADRPLEEWQKQALILREEFGQEHEQIQSRIQTLLKELERIIQRDWTGKGSIGEQI